MSEITIPWYGRCVNCDTCGVELTDAEVEGAIEHECPPGFAPPSHPQGETPE